MSRTPCIHGVSDHTLCARCQRILTIREVNSQRARTRARSRRAPVVGSPLPGLTEETAARHVTPSPEVIADAREAARIAAETARLAAQARRQRVEEERSAQVVAVTRAALRDLRRSAQ